MKKQIYLFSLLLMMSCQGAIIESADPFYVPEVPEISMDFSHRESSSASGFVRFTNLSKGFQSYSWNFGYQDKNGITATSREASPYTFFPVNGEYLIILKGVDINGKEQTIHRYILVTNKVG